VNYTNWRGSFKRKYVPTAYVRRYTGGWVGRAPRSTRVTAARTYRRVVKDVRFLKRAIEIKQADVVLANIAIPAFPGASAPLQPLNFINQGNQFCQRIGNKIAMKDLHVKLQLGWKISPNYDTSHVESNAYRIVVVYDKLASNASGQGVATTVPNFNTIFSDRLTDGTGTGTWLSSQNHDVGDRFQVLYDKIKQLTPVVNPVPNEAPTPDEPAYVKIPYIENFVVPLKGKTTVFNQGNEITEGALYLILIAAHYKTMSADSIWNEVGVDMQSVRLRYFDS